MDIQITHDADRAVSAAGARVLGSRIPCDFRMRLCEFSGPELKVWLCLFLHVQRANTIPAPAWIFSGRKRALARTLLMVRFARCGIRAGLIARPPGTRKPASQWHPPLVCGLTRFPAPSTGSTWKVRTDGRTDVRPCIAQDAEIRPALTSTSRRVPLEK